MDHEQRIANFKNMAEADPANELGHFSLGKAYFDAGRYEEATEPLRRVLELNQGFSKAYQLLGESFLKLNQSEKALEILKKGYDVADQRGDLMPRDAMGKALQNLGHSVQPKSKNVATFSDMDGERVLCVRCGQAKSKIPERPFKGPLGERILTSICHSCWREWVQMGTKVINELRLDFSNPNASQVYDQYMKEFLQLQD